ncbi:ABC transporter ATP-binding protein [Candidatus Dependentiae bacterium]|nr:ABC transporter ATP-binding protein [Candidatus Dependentiae bacterium]
MPRTKSPIIHVDFEKPWWHIIWLQKWRVFIISAGEACINIFDTVSPIILGWVFTAKRYDYFAYFSIAWLGSIVFQDFVRKLNSTLQLRCIHSVHFNAHQFLLQVDPMYHAHRETGAVLGKIDRASRAYENFLDSVLIDILGYSAGIVTALISLMYESVWLGFVLLGLLAIILAFNLGLSRYFIIPRERTLIDADDAVKAMGQENLSQINLIRSYFASNEINHQLKQTDIKLFGQERSLWNANITMWSIIKIMYLFTVFLLGTYILGNIHHGNLTAVDGIALMVMYIQGTYGIISLERPIRTMTRSLTRIKDLFAFLPTFGKQSYPVLQESDEEMIPPVASTSTISVVANDISFSYTDQNSIFDHHNLSLFVNSEQISKLYGVIGPSGVGKSTLISILGGQLNPLTGSVLIDGIDIYAIDDYMRRSLIAMQGQIASSLRGSLRYNLLFGLPEEKLNTYTDEYLIDILGRVGLWTIFESKNGLDTLIGEGGLTISGGQRQRLNFASLYLRANAYKPALILIDEPTSSLDEVSEQAITAMILELAYNALTIVIAHRIKTIEKAVGILDFSLIAQEKDLIFYSHDELIKRSVYYQQLMGGTATLE